MASAIRSRRRLSLNHREALLGFAYISPWLLGFLIFTGGPIVVSAYLSLTDYQVLVAPRFVGFANYSRALSGADEVFWKAVYNTIYYAVLFVPMSIVGSLAAALLLNVRIRAQALFRTLFFIPSITPTIAAVFLWIWILNPDYGPINNALYAVGIQAPGWLGFAGLVKAGADLDEPLERDRREHDDYLPRRPPGHPHRVIRGSQD